MDVDNRVTFEEFTLAAKQFCEISDSIDDGWKLYENKIDVHKTYLGKQSFFNYNLKGIDRLLKAEYVIFFNLSYGAPSFSFNIWDSSGVLLSLDDLRQMSFININKEDFYSVITQQEHPVLNRPYFIMHPCHTPSLLADFRNISKNIIVTFLGLITPLIRLNLPIDYGL